MKKAILITVVMMAAVTLVISATSDTAPLVAPTETTETAYVEVTTEAHTETTIATETLTETIITPIETEPPKQIYYNVNLSAEVQDVIFAECERYGINPAIVIAMIERESRFNANAIGDNGNSFGLMQIQPRWHSKRMEKLGCNDLLDPIQNIKVGIDYLGELYNRYGNIEKALVAYNKGSYTGTITNYATSIMARANEVCYG